MIDRRFASRRPIQVFFNKYLRGYPYLCRSLDLSVRGALALTFCEPEQPLSSFPVELRLPGAPDSVWVWARGVWRQDGKQAIEFVKLEASDERRLGEFLCRIAA